jgi:O-methyltransferase
LSNGEDAARAPGGSGGGPDPRDLYLDLLKSALTGALLDEAIYRVAPARSSAKGRVFEPLRRLLAARDLFLARSIPIGPATFAESPPPQIPVADTMIGPRGLENIQECVADVIDQGVEGDLIEAGVWRGGAAVFMRALVEAYQDPDRTVWVADSFRGLPTPSESGHAADVDDEAWAEMDWLGIPIETVKQTFQRYGLLDDRVQFLVGWFADTLPNAPLDRLAVIRIDADMYGSTMDALTALYPRLSAGGYVIIDDYWLPKCRAAVDDFRRVHDIADEVVRIDRAIAYWRRSE